MPNIYQFVKYSSATSIESIREKCKSGAVICFDLEDGISNWIDETKSKSQKQEYRNALHTILSKLNSENQALNFGVRLNSDDLGEQELDIEVIPSGSLIPTILLPKVETGFHINDLVDKLAAKNIIYNELIPIIETRKGLQDLESILLADYPINKVGFGHCDYNLSIGAFPFFHQDSNEYWKWANRIIKVLLSRNIKFINSAYLNLDNPGFFKSLLSHLQHVCKGDFGQFTLNHQQTQLCSSFSNPKSLNEGISKNRLDLGVNKAEIESLIASFVADNKGNGFTINPENKILISPQEYGMAKRKLENCKENTVHFTFVGGCFPVQWDILYEDIFHQTLKREVESNLDVNFKINIIRYEKFGDCLEKISRYKSKNPIDYLVFHIRPEPFLRLTKLYYKYLDTDFKLRHSFNLPFLRILNPEKYDLLRLSQRSDYSITSKQSKFHKTLVNFNYLSGYCIGNEKYALNKYLNLVGEVIGYCDKKNIKLIVLGPAKRSGTFMETILSEKLEKFVNKHLSGKNINYVDGMVKHTQNGVRYFNENGIHATKLYHDLIAKRLYAAIEKLYDRLTK
jgi:citrate lyase beta subunit